MNPTRCRRTSASGDNVAPARLGFPLREGVRCYGTIIIIQLTIRISTRGRTPEAADRATRAAARPRGPYRVCTATWLNCCAHGPRRCAHHDSRGRVCALSGLFTGRTVEDSPHAEDGHADAKKQIGAGKGRLRNGGWAEEPPLGGLELQYPQLEEEGQGSE
jgi:hypothetical protein